MSYLFTSMSNTPMLFLFDLICFMSCYVYTKRNTKYRIIQRMVFGIPGQLRCHEIHWPSEGKLRWPHPVGVSVSWSHSPIAHDANPTMTALAASPAFGALTSSSSSPSPTVALKNDTSPSSAKMNALHSSIYGANSHILTREAQNPSVAATACSRT